VCRQVLSFFASRHFRSSVRRGQGQPSLSRRHGFGISRPALRAPDRAATLIEAKGDYRLLRSSSMDHALDRGSWGAAPTVPPHQTEIAPLRHRSKQLRTNSVISGGGIMLSPWIGTVVPIGSVRKQALLRNLPPVLLSCPPPNPRRLPPRTAREFTGRKVGSASPSRRSNRSRRDRSNGCRMSRYASTTGKTDCPSAFGNPAKKASDGALDPSLRTPRTINESRFLRAAV
jgi:hypothetical protein